MRACAASWVALTRRAFVEVNQRMKNNLARLFLGAVVILAGSTGGCGNGAGGADTGAPSDTSTGDTATSDTATGDTGSGDSMAPVDGSSGDASTDGATSDEGPPTDAAASVQLGFVTVTQQTINAGGTPMTYAAHSANFQMNTGTGGCRVRTELECVITTCPMGSTAPMQVSAGAITISGGTGAPIMLTPGANGAYMPSQVMAARWAPMDSVMVSGAGATVPAFTAMVNFPAQVTLTQPMVTPTTTVRIPRSASYSFRWDTTVTTGNMRVLIATAGTDGSSTGVECAFPLITGSGTVPVTVLSDLPAGSGALLLSALSETTVNAGTDGPWRVRLSAGTSVFAGAAMIE